MKPMTTMYLSTLAGAAVLAVSMGLAQHALNHGDRTDRAQSERWTTPDSIKREHEHLHQQMAAALNAGGETAEAARSVRDVLRPHFQREEELAMPALSLLQPLSHGELTEDMRPMIERMRTLRAELPEMLEEHRQIHAALKKLEHAAAGENKPEHAEFARTLMLHAQHEEQVLYPAAILVGRHLELRFGAAAEPGG